MRRNIDAWGSYIDNDSDSGIEAIVTTASGCGVTVKDYGRLLAHDPAYAHTAERVSNMTRDLSEVLIEFEAQLSALISASGQRVAFHPPCTLQHGQQIRGKVERILSAAGGTAVLCADSHLCCGSAGTYSILQPTLAYQLRDQKLNQLHATNTEVIVTANIGCIAHLQSGTAQPVLHWIEWLDQALQVAPPVRNQEAA
jgi:glycolate oxidase iron-sulfur subunit